MTEEGVKAYRAFDLNLRLTETGQESEPVDQKKNQREASSRLQRMGAKVENK